MLTYVCVRSASRQGLFRALHRNIAVRQRTAAQAVPRRTGFGGENSPPNGVRRVVKQLRRGARVRSARVLILTCHRCQGRENFSGLCPRNFSALFLYKMNARKRNKAVAWGCGGIIPPQGARGYNTLAGVRGVLPPLHGVKMNERADSFHRKRGANECLRIFTT